MASEVHLGLLQSELMALVLIVLSAVFNTIYHETLLGYLISLLHLTGTALKLFVFYRSDHC